MRRLRSALAFRSRVDGFRKVLAITHFRARPWTLANAALQSDNAVRYRRRVRDSITPLCRPATKPLSANEKALT